MPVDAPVAAGPNQSPLTSSLRRKLPSGETDEADGLGTRGLRPSGPGDYFVITMKARLIRIGNSRGVRLPKTVIEEAGLDDDIELSVEDRRVVITSARCARAGWEEAARRLGAHSDGLLDQQRATRFDEDEWRW